MLWQDNHFLPGPSDAFLGYFNGKEEYERRFYSNTMTRFFDLVPGNNLKRWLQQHNLLRSQVVQATQMSASRAKTVRSIKGRKSLSAGEWRGKNMQRREKSGPSFSRKTVNTRENVWNVYCFATNQMRDETAKDNRQTAQHGVVTT